LGAIILSAKEANGSQGGGHSSRYWELGPELTDGTTARPGICTTFAEADVGPAVPTRVPMTLNELNNQTERIERFFRPPELSNGEKALENSDRAKLAYGHSSPEP